MNDKITVIRNLEGKRICDMSADRKSITIVRGGYVTTVSVDQEARLKVENKRMS